MPQQTVLAKCDIAADWSRDFSQCLYEWQGLEAGGLALLAALIGARILFEQIRQTDEHRLDEIRRRHNAARVALPLALSEISVFVQKIADNVATELESYGNHTSAEPRELLIRKGFGVEPLERVELPENVLPAMQSFVETLDDEREIRHIAELLSSIQILSSRYHDLDFNQAGMELTLYGRLLDAAKVGFLNDQLYNYGRYIEDDTFAVVEVLSNVEVWEKIHAKSHSLVFSRESPDFFFAELKKCIEGFKNRKVSPWLKKMGL